MQKKIRKILRKSVINPLLYFIKDSRAVGILLIICTVASMLFANMPFSSGAYIQFWDSKTPIPSHLLHLPHTLSEWINSFLMSFFFVMAGMEIKREILVGELSSINKAVIPLGAAIGGMLVPAIIFTAFNINSGYGNGWGVPTATDIAFSLGVASILGKRVPFGLKILLMALAIMDDLGIIIVIALFYGGHLNGIYLLVAAGLYIALLLCNRYNLKFGVIQIILGLLLWYAMFNTGIEASISGVLFAFAIPTDYLPKLEKALHYFVNFLILPLFALANTAILLPNNIADSLQSPVSLGIIFGLLVGKPLGIYLVSKVLVVLKIGRLPENITWAQVVGMGILAGIGFTMSIFTSMLAFQDEAVRDIAKIAILFAVLLSLIISFVYFGIIGKRSSQSA